jgi:hypothetical protein
LSLADVVAVMRDGRIEQVGPPKAVYGRPATRWVVEFLGDTDIVPGAAAEGVTDWGLGRFPADRARHGRGRPATGWGWPSTRTAPTPLPPPTAPPRRAARPTTA